MLNVSIRNAIVRLGGIAFSP